MRFNCCVEGGGEKLLHAHAHTSRTAAVKEERRNKK